jgi:polyisoprenyl-teichoic acid--peptidoglycan teichoic acid transferase
MTNNSNTTETEITSEKNQKKAKQEYSKIKRKFLKHVTLVRIFACILIVGVLTIFGFLAYKGAESLNIPLYYDVVYNFITVPTEQLPSFNNRTNILVMGRAGGGHDGPDLTDTMMMVSISLTDKNIKIISIPRDTWVPEIRAKINSAYYWGNQKNQGEGIIFAKAIMSKIVGTPIQYGVVIDFSGFKEIINEIGGIKVDVENSFTDYYYPIVGRENDTCDGKDLQYMCRYETITFNAGTQIMDGETALKFVRSRHALGVEGTDLARQARQGKVIEAIKNKLMDKETYTNIRKDIAIIKAVFKSTQMDIDYPTMAILARLVYESRNSITSYVVPQELLITPPVSKTYDMQSVFIPKKGNGNWSEINNWVSTTLQGQTY